MTRGWLWSLAKALEGLGLVVILLGLVLSVQTGMRDEGMKSMTYELYGLVAGGVIFVVGWVLERTVGRK